MAANSPDSLREAPIDSVVAGALLEAAAGGTCGFIEEDGDAAGGTVAVGTVVAGAVSGCLLYTSDAADD